MAIKIIAMQVCNILHYCMAKIYCHINQCNASVQYFAILHANKYCMIAEKQTYKTESMFILTSIGKDKCRSMMRQILQ